MKLSAHNRKPTILVLAYKRPRHLATCLESISKNSNFEDYKTIISIDGPRGDSEKNLVNDVIEVADDFKRKMRNVDIWTSQTNRGLSCSVIDSINRVFTTSESIIVIEDDLILGENFLNFCKKGLETYKHDSRVCAISGFSLPIKHEGEAYFLRGADCWGWATWKDRWALLERDGNTLVGEIKKEKLVRAFDLDYSYQYTRMLERQARGERDSWAIRWHASMFIKGKLSLYPRDSLVQNIGNDGSGTNMGISTSYMTMLSNSMPIVGDLEVKETGDARSKLISYYKTKFRKNWKQKTLDSFKRLFYPDKIL